MRSVALLFYLALGVSGAILYEGGTILAFNETTQKVDVLRDASLLIEGNTITRVSTERLGPRTPINTTIINATDKIISPGYIDTHAHLWQTPFKTIASNTTLAEYFQRYSEYSQAEQYFTTDDLYLAQLFGSLERLHVGTTTVLDHAHASWSNETTDACINGSLDSGVRTVYSHAVHIITNGWPWEDQIRKFRALTQDPRFNHDTVLTLGLAYDSFYFAPSSNITELWNITKGSNLSAVTAHYLGGPWGHTNSAELLQALGWLNDTIPIVISHASFMTYRDAQLLRETNQYISTTVESEFHFGHNHPYAHLIQDQASLGVDCHFTFSSSMVNQGRMWLQNLRASQYLVPLENWEIPKKSPMSVEQAFYLITRAGALSIRRPDLGIIQEGAKADLVVFDTSSPNMLGWSDPIAAIILHSDVGDIEDVLVNGVFKKQGGKLLHENYNEISKRLTASAKRIQKIWADTDFTALEGTFDSGEGGTPYTNAIVIDTFRGNGTGY